MCSSVRSTAVSTAFSVSVRQVGVQPMRLAHEPRLAAVGFDDDAQIVQEIGHLIVEGIIRGLPGAVVVGGRFGEEQAEHRRVAGVGMHDAARVEDFGNPGLQVAAIVGQGFQRRGFVEDAQAFLGGGKTDRMGGIGAAMAAPP